MKVVDAYERRCAISGERTLPVLQAAHIRPYAQEGPHEVSNGLLLRADIHTLFDEGYLTVTPDYRVRVSRRLNADYGNGRIYYAFQDRRLAVLPSERPELRCCRASGRSCRRGTTSSGTTTACSWGEVGTAQNLGSKG